MWLPRPGMGRPPAQNARQLTDRIATRDATRALRPQERPLGHAKWPPWTGMGQLPAHSLTHMANKEAPALSGRRLDGSMTHGKRNAVAQAGPRDGVESDDEDR